MKNIPLLRRRITRFFTATVLIVLLLLCSCAGNGSDEISFENAEVTISTDLTETAASTAPEATTAETTVAADPTTQTEPTEEATTQAEVTEAQTAEQTDPTEPIPADNDVQEYVVNTNTGKFHYPTCASVKDIKSKNRTDRICSRQTLLDEGYVPCGRCKP